MSRRNGDRARFQKERMRKMLRRQRIQALVAAVQARKNAGAGVVAGASAETESAEPSAAMHDEGGPMRTAN